MKPVYCGDLYIFVHYKNIPATAVKKLLLLLVIIIMTIQAQAQYFSKWERAYTWPYFSTALVFSNPLSGSSKYGGGVERKIGNISYMAGYYIYNGAYPGAMADYDMKLYARRAYKHRNKDVWYRNFVYARPFVGIAGYNSDKLSFMGVREGVTWYEKGYYGGSAGWGRRYFNRYLFMTMRVGLRATSFSLDPIEPEARQFYRQFFVTGPGSVLEVNFQFGIQY